MYKQCGDINLDCSLARWAARHLCQSTVSRRQGTSAENLKCSKHEFCSKLLCIMLYVSHTIMAQKSPYASNNSFRMSVQWITCKWIRNIWAKFILKHRTRPNVFWVFTHHKHLQGALGPWLVFNPRRGASQHFLPPQGLRCHRLLFVADIPSGLGALTEYVTALSKIYEICIGTGKS